MFLFSSLLEIRPSNINNNIYIFIKEIQKKIFLPRGAPGGGEISIFFIISDRTLKLKY